MKLNLLMKSLQRAFRKNIVWLIVLQITIAYSGILDYSLIKISYRCSHLAKNQIHFGKLPILYLNII